MLIFCWSIFNRKIANQTKQYYQLNEQGQWQWFDDAGKVESWQITDASRVAVYGCYITLTPNQENTNAVLVNLPNHSVTNYAQPASARLITKQQFIFKDSLNTQDYARLCRVIQHCY